MLPPVRIESGTLDSKSNNIEHNWRMLPKGALNCLLFMPHLTILTEMIHQESVEHDYKRIGKSQTNTSKCKVRKMSNLESEI